MKRFPRFARAAVVGVLATFVLAVPTAADAAGSCPDFNNGGSYAVCWYDSDNFNNFINALVPTGSVNCATVTLTLADSERNRINSVRNRPPCYVRLQYYCGTSVCLGELMVPFSEDSEITPINAIDKIQISYR